MPHSVHTSELRSFRGCRRRHEFAYVDGYVPTQLPRPLEFGIAFHVGMEQIFDPASWDTTTPQEKAQRASKAFGEECKKQKELYLLASGLSALPDEVEEDYAARVDLGGGMFGYYTEVIHPRFDQWFRPVKVEVKFSVPIMDPLWPAEPLHCTNSPSCGQFHSNDPSDDDSFVFYEGRVDAIVQHKKYGYYFIWDHKRCTENTNILTPTGWTTHGQIQVGDKVIGSNGNSINVTGVYHKGVDTIWEVCFSDGTVIECADDHPFIVQWHYSAGGKYNHLVTKKLTAREIRDLPTYLQRRVWVPKIKPVEFEQTTKLPMDPYALGSLMGDGCFTGRELTYSSKSGETVELLNQVLSEGSSIVKKGITVGDNSWRVVGTHEWRDVLRSLGLWYKKSAEKFIPQEYLFANIDNRVALLQGLMDTDGDTKKYRFSTMSEQLANDFCHLVWSLGGTASKSKNQDDLWKVTFQCDFECHRLARKRVGKERRSKETHRTIVEVRETERTSPMVCISVDAEDHLYATNNFILTHNTAASLNGNMEFLETDDQITNYCWALGHVLGINVQGFIYQQLRKAYPKPPRVLKRARLGKIFSTDRNQETSAELFIETVAKHDPIAYEEGAYADYIAYLTSGDATLYYTRNTVLKSRAELNAAATAISQQAWDLTNEHTFRYPSPSKMNCNNCAYRTPCVGMNNGEDIQVFFDTSMIQTDRRYWMEKAPNSDKGA